MPITTAAGLGAATAAHEWSAFILEALGAASVVLASGARRIGTTAHVVHVPRITGDAATGWYDELEEIGEGVPPGDDLILTPKKVATIAVLSNESVNDSSPSVLNATGDALVTSVARELDRALLDGTGTAASKQPRGVLRVTGIPTQPGGVSYATIVRAAGRVRAAGGVPNALYLNPTDHVELQLAADGLNRPLLQDTADGPVERIAGMRLWPTPAVPAGTALAAQADNIVVAVREDPTVAFSADARFTADGTVARVIARADVGVGDPDALCLVATA